MIGGGDRSTRLRWLASVTLMVLADVGLLYSQILALQQQRAGESYVRETLMFFTAITVWYLVSVRVWNSTGTELANGTRVLIERIVERLRRLPLNRFEKLGRGMIKMRLTGDAQRVAGSAGSLIGVPTALIRMSFGAILAFSISTTAAILATGAMLLMGILIGAQLKIMGSGFRQMASSEVQVYDLLRGHVSGVTQIKLHAPRAGAIERAFSTVSDGLRDVRLSIFAAFFERHHAAKTVLYGILGVNVFLLPLVFSLDNEIIRESNLVLVWVVFSVFSIVFTLPQLSNSADALQRLRDLAAQLEEGLEPAVDVKALSDRFVDFQSLSVHELSFHYEGVDGAAGFTAGPIDTTFQRGEIVFITGHNGSGKSTFLKMLTGLYTAKSGEVRVDDTVIGEDEMADYRELFGTIFAEQHLFHRAFGVTAEAEAGAHGLLKDMQIAHKTGIVDGRITNRSLSTGQKKRLSMVLAQLQDRPILIFDEWAADQAPDFRALYYHKILPALSAAGKLVIAVTHDDQYFDCADRTLHFREGKLQSSWEISGGDRL